MIHVEEIMHIQEKLPFNTNQIGYSLGEGSEGTVYEYHHNKVIKFMRGISEYSDKPISNRRFLDVMKELKRRHSTMYIKVYDYGIVQYEDEFGGNSFLYYIAEKLERGVFCINKKLWSRRATLLKKRGLVYRDPHVDNIMVDEKGNQKLIDLTAFCWTIDNPRFPPLSSK